MAPGPRQFLDFMLFERIEVTGKHTITWGSLWLPLFSEACSLACSKSKSNPQGVAGATIVVARAAWESYFHEFVERRKIHADVKRLRFPNDVREAMRKLRAPEPGFGPGEGWEQLALLNKLRNAIVHHDATPRSLGTARGDWLERLRELGVVVNISNLTWESAVLTRKVSRWGCEVVGNAILQAEALPHGRSRSQSLVSDPVRTGLRQLATCTNES